MSDWITRGFDKRGERIGQLEQRIAELESEREELREAVHDLVAKIAELEFVLDCPPTARAAKREDGFIKKIAELERKCDLLLTAANTWQDKYER